MTCPIRHECRLVAVGVRQKVARHKRIERRLKIMKALASILFVLFLGSVVTAAPASAVWGTDVYLTAVPQSNVNAWIKTTNMLGTEKIVHASETAHSVRFFCPPSDGYYMQIQGPAGSFRNTDNGDCYTPTKDGTYTVWLYHAFY